MITTASLRPLWKQSLKIHRGSAAATASFSSTSAALNNNISSRDQPFFEKGWLDERGLTRFTTLHELQSRSCAVFSDNPLYGVYNADKNDFEFGTYGSFGEQVDQSRRVLQHLGVGPDDKIAVISNNRWEWAALSCAAFSLKASMVPMYEAQRPSDWTYICRDAQPKALFCATQDIYDRVQAEVQPNAPVPSVLCLDAAFGEPHAFQTLMQDKLIQANTGIVEPTPDDLASLIYTSGTTGKPKGVELLHSNIVSNVMGVRNMVAEPKEFFSEEDRALAFLPWAHVFGQTIDLWLPLAHGTSSAICRGMLLVQEDLQLARPTALASVPLLFKKVYDGVHQVMETANPRRKFLMQKALELGSKNADHVYRGAPPMGFVERLQFSVLDKLVLTRIRDRLGGRLKYAAVGGAACPPKVLHFMDSLGIPVLEGYGLTETSPVITMNSPEPNGRKVGRAGMPLEGVSVFVVDPATGEVLPEGEDGEICCTGPNVMRGYYNKPEATEEVISVGPNGERMFHTGDMGHMDPDGFVKVTGRIKEQFKLDNGKYITPTPLEDAVGLSRFVAQCLLVGANRPHTSMLIVPEWAALRGEFGIADDVGEEELANDPRVIDLMDAELAMACYNHKKYEIPTKWAFVAPFTVANDMLTQKLSIRRHKVQEVYTDLVDGLYGGEGADGEKVAQDKAA